MTYDADGNVLSTTVKDAGGNVISVSSATFDGNGNQLTTTDGDGNTVSYTCDAEGHVLTMTDARGTTHYSYDADGNQISVTDPDGNTVRQTFDGEGRVLTRTDSAGTTTYQYDANGNQTLITGPDGSTTSMTYDANGNVLSTIVRDAGGNVISSSTATLDANGNQLTRTDANGHAVSYTYDAEGHVLSVTNALGTTHYSYDANGNQLSITDPDGNTTSYTFDAEGHVLTVTSPIGTTTNTYDADGNLLSTVDALGRKITYAYDDGRVTTETWYNADGSVADTLSYTYDADGNVLTASNGAGTYTMTYDSEGNLLTRTNPNGITLTYGYDADGNVTSIADSQGGLTTLTYNSEGQVATKSYQDSSTQFSVSYTYDANGNVLTETRTQNGAAAGSTQNTYDGDRLTSIVQTDGNGNTIGSFSYSYDAAGQLTSQTVNGVTTSFGYDATGQLIQAGTQNYSYDANGNPTNGGDTVGTDNQLSSDGTWNYSYDAVGNLVGKTAVDGSSSWTYTYSVRNQLLSAVETDGSGATITSVSYTYDIFGNRLSRTVTNTLGTTTQGFVYDGSTLYADTDGSGTITMRYIADVTGPNTWLARVDAQGDSGSAWLLGDHQGSVTSIVSMSGAGYTQLTYGTFGSVVGLVYNDGSGFTMDVSNAPAVGEFTWQGGLTDSTTHFVHFGSNPGREDDTEDNRWLQPDTSLSYGSNLYEAFNNAPTNGTDPTGHLFVTDAGAKDAWVKQMQAWGLTTYSMDWSDGTSLLWSPDVNKLRQLRDADTSEAGWQRNVASALMSGSNYVIAGSSDLSISTASLDAADIDTSMNQIANWKMMAQTGKAAMPSDPGQSQFYAFMDGVLEYTGNKMDKVRGEIANAHANVEAGNYAEATSHGLKSGIAAFDVVQWKPSANGMYGLTIEAEQATRNAVQKSGTEGGVDAALDALDKTVNALMIAHGPGKTEVMDTLLKAKAALKVAQSVKTSGDGMREGDVEKVIESAINVLSGLADGVDACKSPEIAAALKRTQTALHMVQAARAAGKALDNGDYISAVKELGNATIHLQTLLEPCFVAGTPLLTPTGDKPIEQFCPSDLILSRDEHNVDAPVVVSVVEEVFVRTGRILHLHVGGQVIRTTGEHPFWVYNKGWVAAGKLEEGDLLSSHDGQWVAVEEAFDTGEYETVYNLKVADHHTYFVGSRTWALSVWVHNGNGLACGQIRPLAEPTPEGYTDEIGWNATTNVKVRKDPNGPGYFGEPPVTTRNADAVAYERRIAGAESYFVKHPTEESWVQFDGLVNGALVDAKHVKNTNVSPYMPYSAPNPNLQKAMQAQLLKEARRQSATAAAGGFIVEWHTNNINASTEMLHFFRENGITNIAVVYDP